MRRTWIYSMLAISVGLLLVLVPLITLVSLGAEDHSQATGQISQSLKDLDGSSQQRSKSDTATLEGLALSFAIAVAGFMLLRKRRPQTETRWAVGQWPY